MTERQDDCAFDLIGKYRLQIMGFAALWLFLYHTQDSCLLFSKIPGIGDVEALFSCNGYAGADMFFFISGIGMVYSISKHTVPQFYLRRFLRIWPPYAVIGTIAAFVFKWSIPDYLMTITGVSFYARSLFSLIWFVPAIGTFYLIFPLYDLMMRKIKHKIIPTVIIFVIWLVLSFLWKSDAPRGDLSIFTNRIPVFTLGVYCGYLSREKKIKFGSKTRIILFAVFALGIIFMTFSEYVEGLDFSHYLIKYIGTTMVAPIMCYYLAKIFSLIEKASFIGKAFSLIGVMSLEMYCSYEIIMNIFRPRFFGKMENHLYTLVLFVMVLAGSALLYQMTRLIRKKIMI